MCWIIYSNTKEKTIPRYGDLCGDSILMEIVQENKDEDIDNILREIN